MKRAPTDGVDGVICGIVPLYSAVRKSTNNEKLGLVSVKRCAILLVTFLALLSVAGYTQDAVQTPSTQASPSWKIVAFGGVNLHGMRDFNQEIARFNDRARSAAEALSDELGVTLSVSGRIPDLKVGFNYGGALLYHILPYLAVGASAEQMTSSASGSVDITANDMGVSFNANFSLTTLGITGMLLVDLAPVIDGPISGSLFANWGYHRTSASASIGVEFSGIEEDPELLNMEKNLDTSMSGTGYRLGASATYQASESFDLVGTLGMRGLSYQRTDFNFRNLRSAVDVDLSGPFANASFVLSF